MAQTRVEPRLHDFAVVINDLLFVVLNWPSKNKWHMTRFFSLPE